MTTGVQSQKDFNSLPHAEVDAKQALSNYSITLFQLTTSRRGRRKRHSLRWKQNYFNSLPHAEVDSYIFCIVNMLYIFQLTTSRRGRRRFRPQVHQDSVNFNSLPHAEVDDQVIAALYAPTGDFNSLPHAEVDSNLSQNLWTLTIDSITNRIINLCFLL